MSIKLMSAIFETEFRDLLDEEGNVTKASTAKLICLALADHANDEGEGAYPSLSRLQLKTALSRQCVVNTLDALKYNGIARLEGVSKRNTSNYTIEPSCFPKAVDKDGQPILLVNPVASASQPGLPEVVNPVDPNHPLTVLETPSVVVQKANAKVDAILDQELKAAGRISYPKRESLPEAIRELIDVFVEVTNIKPISKNMMQWLSAGNDWLEIGATPDDIREAWKYSQGKYAVLSPHSLTNAINAIHSGSLKPKNVDPPLPPYYQPYVPETEKPNKMSHSEWLEWKKTHGEEGDKHA